MISISVDPSSAEAPFEQVRRQIAAATSAGDLEPGRKLPTVRQLAADLGLAVNTVARAYRELESERIIETHGRRGTFVASRRATNQTTSALVAQFVADVRAQGLSRHEAVNLVEQGWGPGERSAAAP